MYSGEENSDSFTNCYFIISEHKPSKYSTEVSMITSKSHLKLNFNFVVYFQRFESEDSYYLGNSTSFQDHLV